MLVNVRLRSDKGHDARMQPIHKKMNGELTLYECILKRLTYCIYFFNLDVSCAISDVINFGLIVDQNHILTCRRKFLRSIDVVNILKV